MNSSGKMFLMVLLDAAYGANRYSNSWEL